VVLEKTLENPLDCKEIQPVNPKVNEAEVDAFLEFSCFFDDAVDVGILISGSSAFLNPT